MLQHIGMGTQLEAVDRRVADNALAKAPEARVVVNDAEVAGQGEELVEAAHDHHVQVQEQRLTLEAVQVALEGGQLLPGAVALAGRQMNVQRRNGQALHFGANPGCAVGQADKAKISADGGAPWRRVG
jgi:hypothetical protein